MSRKVRRRARATSWRTYLTRGWVHPANVLFEPLSPSEGYTCDGFSPRALLDHQQISVSIMAQEFFLLMKTLEWRAAQKTAQDPEQSDFADYLYRRIAELLEASR